MKWTYAFLVALLLQTAVAVSGPNPFLGEISGVFIDNAFTVTWVPTTAGTVTVTLVAVDDNNVPGNDLMILGCTLIIFRSRKHRDQS